MVSQSVQPSESRLLVSVGLCRNKGEHDAAVLALAGGNVSRQLGARLQSECGGESTEDNQVTRLKVVVAECASDEGLASYERPASIMSSPVVQASQGLPAGCGLL